MRPSDDILRIRVATDAIEIEVEMPAQGAVYDKALVVFVIEAAKGEDDATE